MSKIGELFFLVSVFVPFALMAAIVNGWREAPPRRSKRRAF